MLLLQLSGLVVNSVAIILNGTDVLPVTVTGGGRGGGAKINILGWTPEI